MVLHNGWLVRLTKRVLFILEVVLPLAYALLLLLMSSRGVLAWYTAIDVDDNRKAPIEYIFTLIEDIFLFLARRLLRIVLVKLFICCDDVCSKWLVHSQTRYSPFTHLYLLSWHLVTRHSHRNSDLLQMLFFRMMFFGGCLFQIFFALFKRGVLEERLHHAVT